MASRGTRTAPRRTVASLGARAAAVASLPRRRPVAVKVLSLVVTRVDLPPRERRDHRRFQVPRRKGRKREVVGLGGLAQNEVVQPSVCRVGKRRAERPVIHEVGRLGHEIARSAALLVLGADVAGARRPLLAMNTVVIGHPARDAPAHQDGSARVVSAREDAVAPGRRKRRQQSYVVLLSQHGVVVVEKQNAVGPRLYQRHVEAVEQVVPVRYHKAPARPELLDEGRRRHVGPLPKWIEEEDEVRDGGFRRDGRERLQDVERLARLGLVAVRHAHRRQHRRPGEGERGPSLLRRRRLDGDARHGESAEKGTGGHAGVQRLYYFEEELFVEPDEARVLWLGLVPTMVPMPRTVNGTGHTGVNGTGHQPCFPTNIHWLSALKNPGGVAGAVPLATWHASSARASGSHVPGAFVAIFSALHSLDAQICGGPRPIDAQTFLWHAWKPRNAAPHGRDAPVPVLPQPMMATVALAAQTAAASRCGPPNSVRASTPGGTSSTPPLNSAGPATNNVVYTRRGRRRAPRRSGPPWRCVR